MNVKKELHIAAERNQIVTLMLHSAESITGFVDVSTNPERTKIRTSEGPVWIPYAEIERVSRVINMFH